MVPWVGTWEYPRYRIPCHLPLRRPMRPMHTHAHTRTHTRTHTCIHTHVLRVIFVLFNTHTHTHTHTHTLTLAADLAPLRQILRYGLGQQYKVHADTLRDEEAGVRVATVRRRRHGVAGWCMGRWHGAVAWGGNAVLFFPVLRSRTHNRQVHNHVHTHVQVLIYLNEPDGGGETAFPSSEWVNPQLAKT